jgi:hypothetical protein
MKNAIRAAACLAMSVFASCSHDATAPTQPPIAASPMGTIVVEVKNSCPAWTNVPMFVGAQHVGDLSAPGTLRFQIEPGSYRMSSCSPSGLPFLTFDVRAGEIRLYAVSACGPTPPCP